MNERFRGEEVIVHRRPRGAARPLRFLYSGTNSECPVGLRDITRIVEDVEAGLDQADAA